MFNSISGIITAKFSQQLFLELNGIEWDITIPDISLDALPPVGASARVYTWLDHRQDAMKLFGFASSGDRRVFFDLMKVEGLGPKAAIKILSSISANQLVNALDSEDLSRLERIPGVGKKTAQKMMLTLKGKLSLDDSTQNSRIQGRSSVTSSPWIDVIAALVNMGYDKRLCEETLEKLALQFAEDADFHSKPRSAQEDIMFRRAIQELV